MQIERMTIIGYAATSRYADSAKGKTHCFFVNERPGVSLRHTGSELSINSVIFLLILTYSFTEQKKTT